MSRPVPSFEQRSWTRWVSSLHYCLELSAALILNSVQSSISKIHLLPDSMFSFIADIVPPSRYVSRPTSPIDLRPEYVSFLL